MNRLFLGLRAAIAAGAAAVLVQMTGSLAFGTIAEAGSSQVKATTAVNIRTKPTTSSSRLGVLYRGQKLEAVSSSGGWTKVKYRGKTAYIYSKYLSGSTSGGSNPSSNSASKGTVYTTANLNLRTGPSMSNSVNRVASKGSKLELTGKVSGSYSQIKYSGKTLWAATRYLSSSSGSASQNLPKVTGQAKATTALMIRTTDNSSYKSLGDIPKGTIVDLTGKVSNGVAQIIWQGNVRWVNNKYLTSVSGSSNKPSSGKTPSTTTRYATANLNIWKASTGSSYNGEIPYGSQVAVTGKVSSGRAQIVYNGAIKWVTARYLSSSAPAPKTSTKYATTELNLWHKSTGKSYSGTISKGTSAQATGKSANGRIEIYINGQYRWLTAKYTSNSKPGSSSGGSLNKGYSSGLDKTNSSIQTITRYIWANYSQIKTMYGWRRDVTPDHPAGRAVDVMIPNYKNNKAYGWKIAKYFQANAKKYNIKYIMFDQKIWSVARNSEGWRTFADRGSDNANHLNHVHINSN